MDRLGEIVRVVKPNVFNWIAAIIGAMTGWWTGLPALAQAMLICQGADVMTGLMCAVAGKSHKTETGKINSKVLFLGMCKKFLEWLVVFVCVYVGGALGMESVGAAAMTYMVATELISLIENLTAFGLDVPLLNAILEVAKKKNADG